ncbi:hypothetical protein ACJIZ3_020134 [Penstemon smallii]|uniref:PB1 domain-containing protein n=1 Tax=Penstemon smallii TaxID=265156 RepID=A0ABD3SHR3_9LAMI
METPPSTTTTTTTVDSFDADPPPSKLRLMCSYGGHIVPRPHDKSLCYIGGDTRIIVIHRNNTSLSDLHHRLSKTLNLQQQQPFTLKYQLPNEDLDSLISVSTDEDLENMIDEFDRLNNNNKNSGGGGRLRLFLFPNISSNTSIEQLLETGSTKSEDWFLNALNGKLSNFSISDRGFSESSSVNCLLGLDDDFVTKGRKNSGNGNVNNQEPNSPMVDKNSSFGSTSSTPSLVGANLPPIRVHVEENPKVGLEEQLQPISSGAVRNNIKQEEYANRNFSDDEKSDHGGYRLVQQVQPQVQVQQQQQILPSPGSVSSEGSVTNPLSRQRQVIYQEPIIQIQSRVPANQVDIKSGDQNNSNKVQMQPQFHEPGYVLSNQYDQNHPQLHQAQQFVHPGSQYIPVGAMPMSPYYQIYQNHPQQQHYSHQPVLDQQQYPLYYVPARQTQTYNLPIQQPSYSESAPNVPSSRPQTPPSAYNQGRNVPSSKPEMYVAPQLVQVPSGQQQAQYVGIPQIHHPSQSMAPSSGANSTYTYEFADPSQAQMYYTQQVPPQLAAQYQTMTSAPTMVTSSNDALAQLPTENIRTAQP